MLFNIGPSPSDEPAGGSRRRAQKLVKEPGTLSADHLARAKQTLAEQTARVAEIAVTTSVPATIEVDNVRGEDAGSGLSGWREDRTS